MVSHGERWRAACAAGCVTDLAIGSSDWLGMNYFRFISASRFFASARDGTFQIFRDSSVTPSSISLRCHVGSGFMVRTAFQSVACVRSTAETYLRSQPQATLLHSTIHLTHPHDQKLLLRRAHGIEENPPAYRHAAKSCRVKIILSDFQHPRSI